MWKIKKRFIQLIIIIFIVTGFLMSGELVSADSHAYDTYCVNKGWRKCDAWTAESGAWCDANIWKAGCNVADCNWYNIDSNSSYTSVECCSSVDCPDQTCKIKSCSSNDCSYTNVTNGTSCGTGKSCQSGACITTPTCTGYSNTLDSGDTVFRALSSAGTNTWSAVCTDFSCGSFVCNYSPSNIQNYSGTISGTIGANTQYFNDSSSTQTRKCTYDFWHSDRPSLKVRCIGTDTVRSGSDGDTTGCTGYSHSISSGDSVLGSVSASGSNTWSAVCEDFSCSNYVCNYSSPTYTQPYSGTITAGILSSSTLIANTKYYNSSGSTQARKCTFKVWNSATPSSTGTCVGTVSVANGTAAPSDPTGCTGYSNTLNSGETVVRSVSASGDTWSAICEDFECSGYICNYNSPTFTQNYSGTFPVGSGTIVANSQYFNDSSSTQTRRCVFKTWYNIDPTVKGTCIGTDTVYAEGCPGGVCDSPCSTPSLSFSDSPDPITIGSAVNLRYVVSGANYCTATALSSGAGLWSGAKIFANGTYNNSVTPTTTGTKTYRISCSNSCGTTTRNTSVTVNPASSIPAPSLFLSVSPSSITVGQSVTASWTVSGATSCSVTSATNVTEWKATPAKAYNDGTYNQVLTPPNPVPSDKIITLECFNGTVSSGVKTANFTLTCPLGTTWDGSTCSGVSGTNERPTAYIDDPGGNVSINEGDSVSFDGHGTDPDGTIDVYNWKLGSCSGSLLTSSKSFSRTFSTAGTYTMYLVVIDDDGDWSVNCPSRTITVNTPPSIPIYSCTGSVPAGTMTWGSDEDDDLTRDTSWVYSATDTSRKCEYRCRTGYVRFNNVCVAGPELSFYISSPSDLKNFELGSLATFTYKVSGADFCEASVENDEIGAGNWSGLKNSIPDGTYHNPDIKPTVVKDKKGGYQYNLVCYKQVGTDYAWTSRNVNLRVHPSSVINAFCGTRSTSYPSSVTDWPGGSTYCDSGTNASSPSFPTVGNSVSWDCAGSGGGTDANNCTATNVEESFYCGTISCSDEECEQPKQASCYSSFMMGTVNQFNCDAVGDDCIRTCPNCKSDIKPTDWKEINP